MEERFIKLAKSYISLAQKAVESYEFDMAIFDLIYAVRVLNKTSENRIISERNEDEIVRIIYESV